MNVRDFIFLYCWLIYEQQKEQIFSALPSERADIIRKEAKKFDRFPKEVRLNFVLKLLGYLVQHVRNPHLEMIHPSWIAESLQKEDPAVISALLSQFPDDQRKEVVKHLGALQSGASADWMSAETRDAILKIFTARFAPMGAPWGDPELSVDTLYLLKEEDLMAMIQQIGVRELARAFVLAGHDVLAALVSRFPPDLRVDFLEGVRTVQSEPTEKQKLATKRLSKYDLASMSMAEACLKVGLTKMAAALSEKEDVLRKIAQRLPFDLGMILLRTDSEGERAGDEEAEFVSILRKLISTQRILIAPAPGPAAAQGAGKES